MENKMAMMNMQVRALHRWEFVFDEQTGNYFGQFDDVKLYWNLKLQTGVMIIDDDSLEFINWDTLDEVMQQTYMY